MTRIPDVGNPWLDAGIVPFSTLHYREDPAYWAEWFPADFITESFPGQFRNWFYSLLAMSTVLRREAPFRTIFGYATLFGEDGRADAQELGQRDRVRRGRRADGRRRHALDVRHRPARGQHPLRLARGRRGAARAARPVERLRLLRHLCPPGRVAAGRDGAARRRPPHARPLDPLAPGWPGRAGRRPSRRLRPGCGRGGGLALHRRALDVVPASDPPPLLAGRRRRRPGGGVRDPARRPRGARSRHGTAAPVPVRVDLPEPRRAGRPGGSRTAST